MAIVISYFVAAVFACVGVLAGASFVTVTLLAKGAIHEIGATLLLLCSIVSLATALLSVQLAQIARALKARDVDAMAEPPARWLPWH